MADAKKFPGLILNLVEARLYGDRGTLTLSAAVYDESVWSAVVARIPGHRIYAHETLASDALALVEDQYKDEIADLKKANEALRTELEQAKMELSYQQETVETYVPPPPPQVHYALPVPPPFDPTRRR